MKEHREQEVKQDLEKVEERLRRVEKKKDIEWEINKREKRQCGIGTMTLGYVKLLLHCMENYKEGLPENRSKYSFKNRNKFSCVHVSLDNSHIQPL